MRDTTEKRLREVVHYLLTVLEHGGELGAARDSGAEAARLFALLDGMAFQRALWPRRHTAAEQRRILTEHIDELCG